MSYLEKITDLYEMLKQGKAQEALDKHYADEVVVTEMPTGVQRIGKEQQRAAISEWNKMVEEYHGSGYSSIASNEDERTTMVEAWTEVTTRGNRVKMQQVAVQKWNSEGQITNEQLYYQLGPVPQ